MKFDKNELKSWLKSEGKNRFWLGEEMGVSKRTIDNWFASEFPDYAVKQIERIRAAQSSDMMEFGIAVDGKTMSKLIELAKVSGKSNGELISDLVNSLWSTYTLQGSFPLSFVIQPREGITIEIGSPGAPTVDQIADALLRQHKMLIIESVAAKMEKRGLNASDVLESVIDFPEIPLLHAAAGSPISADGDTWSPPRDVGEGRFACRLHGDSMSPKFPDGSTVILRERDSLKRPVLKSGEIYLFIRQGERCLKIWESRPATKKEIDEGIAYRSEKDGKLKVRVLRSLNPAHADIVVSDEIDWLGWLDPKDQ